MRIRNAFAGACISALLLGLGAAPALASTGTVVRAVTHTGRNADTTGGSPSGTPLGTDCVTVPGRGKAWAWDNLSLRFVVVHETSKSYSVTITASGSFKGFTTRNCEAPVFQNGSVRGYLTETLTSAKGPSRKALPAQESGNVSQTTMVKKLFQGTVANVVGGTYSYTYTLITGKQCVTATSGFTCTKP
jgi:hypothetical protein